MRVDRAAHRHRDEARERDRDREQGEIHQVSMTSLPWLGRDVPDVVSAPCRSSAPCDVIAITKCTYSRRLSPPLQGGTLTCCFLLRILRTRVPAAVRDRGKTWAENWENCCRSVAALPGYISNHVPRAGARFSADFGGCPGFTLRRLGSTACVGWGRGIRAERNRSARVDQRSTCSAMVRASSTSMPRYLTVLSILAWPSDSCTSRRLPVRR